jgi:hypothetical protein
MFRTVVGSRLTLETVISLSRAVPYAAIGMAIWFAMQWYIVRTQDKLWLARGSGAKKKLEDHYLLHRLQ